MTRYWFEPQGKRSWNGMCWNGPIIASILLSYNVTLPARLAINLPIPLNSCRSTLCKWSLGCEQNIRCQNKLRRPPKWGKFCGPGMSLGHVGFLCFIHSLIFLTADRVRTYKSFLSDESISIVLTSRAKHCPFRELFQTSFKFKLTSRPNCLRGLLAGPWLYQLIRTSLFYVSHSSVQYKGSTQTLVQPTLLCLSLSLPSFVSSFRFSFHSASVT